MNFEQVPKSKEPSKTFSDLENGDVFRFTGDSIAPKFWMKIGDHSAMGVQNSKEIFYPVPQSNTVEMFESKLIIQGK
ncbi:hypothetical protein PQC40_gp096 [Escherichia phage EP335]|uniref:Uncharacterized protein n=1 Tax=Escherichia phage EP335 TaxID=2070199 RepID=A0A2Z3DJI1_9CAUD|nr:hypothetical protein PQC40_gp096 [Escherichia phage EP335]AVZ45179.1 hypothetical protein [Escherichia phage EP335]